MVALLTTLISIAGWLVLDKAYTMMQTTLNKKDRITSDDIIAAVNKMTNEARTKGTNILNKLNDRLGSISYPLGSSSSVRDYITKTRNDINNELQNTREEINKVESKLADADSRASNLAYQSEDYRRQYGREQLADIVQEAKAGYDKVSEIESKMGGETNA